MPLPPKIVHSDGDHVVATWHNAIMTRWMGQVRVEAIELAFELGKRLADEYGNRVVAVSLVENGLSIPDADVRRRAAQMMSAAEDYMVFQATILAGRGFWSTAARAAFGGMILLTRGKTTNRVYGSVAEAAPEVARHVATTGLTAAGVERAVAALR